MSSVLQIDRDSCGNIQKELITPDPPKNPNDPPEIDTRFSGKIMKKATGGHIWQKLDSTTANDDVTYKASTDYDHLIKLKALIRLNKISVKEKYKNTVKICYHHNIGHNILDNGECKINKSHYAFVDSHFADANSQFLEDIKSDNKRKMYQRRIGSIPALEGWNTFLPGLTLSPPQAFHFTKDTRVAIPILKGNTNIIFTYKMKLKIAELLKMKVSIRGKNGDGKDSNKKDGKKDDDEKDNDSEYKEIKVNLKYLDFKTDVIATPELWGKYSDLTDEERNWRKSVDENGEPLRQKIYYEDVESFTSSNEVSVGSQIEIKLEGTAAARHIFWFAQLQNAGLSNYTTNPENVYEGWSPCMKSSLVYSTTNRTPEMGPEHFSLDEAYDLKWPTTPTEQGYNVFTYTFNPSEILMSDNAVLLKQCGAILKVQLGNTDPYLQNSDNLDDSDDVPIEAKPGYAENIEKEKYRLHVRVVVLRKMEVYWSEKKGGLEYIISS